MTARYFYIHNNVRHGPVTPEEIRALAQAGTISPATILLDRKTGKQFKAERVNGLFANQDWRTKASAMSVTAERHETATAPPLPTGPSANDEPPSISVNIDTSTMSPGTSPSYWKRTADRIAGLKWYIAIHVAVGIIAFAAACVSLSNQSESQLQSVNDRLSTLSQSQREEFWRGQLRSEESWETARAHTALQAATMDFFPGDNKIPILFSYLSAFFLLLLLPKRRTADRILVSISTLLFFGIAVEGGQRNAHFMALKHMASEVGEFEDKLHDREDGLRHQQESICKTCGGTGKVQSECRTCSAHGELRCDNEGYAEFEDFGGLRVRKFKASCVAGIMYARNPQTREDEAIAPCTKCNGRGFLSCPTCKRRGIATTTCSVCDGSGKVP